MAGSAPGQKVSKWCLQESKYQGCTGQDDERTDHGPIEDCLSMTARLFRSLFPREQDDKDRPEGIVSGQNNTQQSGRHPGGIMETGQCPEDDLLAEKSGKRR